MAAAVFAQNEVQFDLTGQSVVVPNDDLAKVMYYLSCLNSCLNKVIPPEYVNYSNYQRVRSDLREEIKQLAQALSPSRLRNIVLIVVEPTNPLLRGYANEFLKITEATSILGVGVVRNEAIMVGEKSVEVNTILLCTEKWIRDNYTSPMDALTRTYVNIPSPSNVSYKYGSKKRTETRPEYNTYRPPAQRRPSRSCGAIFFALVKFGLGVAIVALVHQGLVGEYDNGHPLLLEFPEQSYLFAAGCMFLDFILLISTLRRSKSNSARSFVLLSYTVFFITSTVMILIRFHVDTPVPCLLHPNESCWSLTGGQIGDIVVAVLVGLTVLHIVFAVFSGLKNSSCNKRKDYELLV